MATPDGLAGVYSNTFPRSETRPFDSVHFISVVYWLSVVGGDLAHERDGTTDLAAWIPLKVVDALPLDALAQYGLILLSARSART